MSGDYSSFKKGSVYFPLGSAGPGATLLRDADPATFFSLEFYAFVLNTYLGPRFLAEVASSGATQINAAVAETLPFNPEYYLREEQFNWPLLAMYRKNTKVTYIGQKKLSKDEFNLCYVLPPILAGEAERLLPALKAVYDIIDYKTEQGFDPGYTPSFPQGSPGDPVWVRAGVARAEVKGASYGAFQPSVADADIVFPTVVISLELEEQEDYAFNDLQAYNGIDGHINLFDTATQTTIVDVDVFSTTAAPTLTSVSPTSGSYLGGTALTLTGAGFLPGSTPQVVLDGAKATSVVVVNSTTITCVTGAHDAYPSDTVTVYLTNTDGQGTSLPGAFTYQWAPAPQLTSSNFSQGDVLGGGSSIVLTGTNLSGASVSFGGTPATVTANTATTVTCTLPAKAAAVTTVAVTTPGGPSNTLPFEFWAPDTDPTCTLVLESPNYSVISGTGTWTPRKGTTAWGETGGFAATQTAGGAALFGPSKDIWSAGISVTGQIHLSDFLHTTAPCEGSAAVVFTPSGTPFTHISGAASAPNNPQLFVDYTRGTVGLSYTSVGVEAWINQVGGTTIPIQIPLSADGNPHCAQWRFKDATTIGGKVDGGAWSEQALATYNVSNPSTYTMIMGASFNYGNQFPANTMQVDALVFFSTKIPDATSVKVNKWAQQRHGVA